MDIDKDQETRDIVSVIISLAENFRLDIIAEGVEKVSQKSVLVESGCEKNSGVFV